VPEDLRALVSDLVSGVTLFDAREAADQADILDWVTSGQQLFRTAPPATPPKHLVVYFIPVDRASGCLLLGDHRKSGPWLPPGGHVWFDLDQQRDWPATTYDPEMRRFVGKLTSAAGRPLASSGRMPSL
jgi:8-oxo-dGTP diphosphatase